ncbi:hypothetical protein BM221_003361 [Beauveria bassiana]|uniref:Uncharacterized protein n=1 Tax=Beauveria bassiana TaxID=176275 RepID=A0A2N6NUF0_BEABA|nr:hypothetical protein BM221_003361 [Beauveria bassiana]
MVPSLGQVPIPGKSKRDVVNENPPVVRLKPAVCSFARENLCFWAPQQPIPCSHRPQADIKAII